MTAPAIPVSRTAAISGIALPSAGRSSLLASTMLASPRPICTVQKSRRSTKPYPAVASGLMNTNNTMSTTDTIGSVFDSDATPRTVELLSVAMVLVSSMHQTSPLRSDRAG